MEHCTVEGIELPRIVRFTSDGRAEWVRWYNLHASEISSSDLPAVLHGPWSKLKSYCLRLSLVVHFLRYVCREVSSEDVDSESVRRAIHLVDYFKSHARKVYSSLHRGPEDRRAEQVVAWLHRHSGACTVRDLQRATVAGINKSSDAAKMLKDLVDRGCGSLENRPSGNGQLVKYFVLAPVSDSVG